MSRTRRNVPKTTKQMAEVFKRKSGAIIKLTTRKKLKEAWKREWEREVE